MKNYEVESEAIYIKRHLLRHQTRTQAVYATLCDADCVQQIADALNIEVSPEWLRVIANKAVEMIHKENDEVCEDLAEEILATGGEHPAVAVYTPRFKGLVWEISKTYVTCYIGWDGYEFAHGKSWEAVKARVLSRGYKFIETDDVTEVIKTIREMIKNGDRPASHAHMLVDSLMSEYQGVSTL